MKILTRQKKINKKKMQSECESLSKAPTKNIMKPIVYPTVYPLEVKLLSEKATLPTRGSSVAAGWDLYSAASVILPAKEKVLVPLDISVRIPPNCYGRIAPRSGLACKHFIDVGAGVIDEDYRGNICVLLFNFSDKDYTINSGDRIAQMILEKIYVTEIKKVNELDDTSRGLQGFGSTGN